MTDILVGVLVWYLLTTLVVLVRYTMKGVPIRFVDLPLLFFLSPFIFWIMVFALFKRRR